MKDVHKYRDGVPVNTMLQIKNDDVIKNFFDKYDNYQISNEFKRLITEHNDIFIENPLIPDLCMKQMKQEVAVFNKNLCFPEANKDLNNYFPRHKFKIKNINNLKCHTSVTKRPNTTNIILKLKNNKQSNPKEILDFCINSNENDMKTVIKGVTGGNVERKEDKEIMNLIKYNNKWILKLPGNNNKYCFNSFELFEYLTNEFLCLNKKLDDCIIYNSYSSNSYKGGDIYICLFQYFEQQKNNNDKINNLNNNNYDEISMDDRTNIFIDSFNDNSNNCLQKFGFSP